MAALTRSRSTLRMGVESVIQLLSVPVKAATVLQAGSLVVADAGFAAPGRADKGLKALGRCELVVDNSAGAAGALSADVLRGTFKWDNDPADPLAEIDLFAICFITDDHTVCKTDGGGTKSQAGKVIQIDPDGIWVETI